MARGWVNGFICAKCGKRDRGEPNPIQKGIIFKKYYHEECFEEKK